MAYRPDRANPRPRRRRARADPARRARAARRGRLRVGVRGAVAARAGVATGTVYRHFPSKADLFAEAFRRASQREVDAVGGRRDRATGGERIAAAVEIFVRRALAAPVRAYALIAEPVDPAVEAERLRLPPRLRRGLRRALRDGVAAGSSSHRRRPRRRRLVGALGEALVGPLARRDRDPDALVATLQSFCVNAIQEPPMSDTLDAARAAPPTRSSTRRRRSGRQPVRRPTCRCARRSSARAAAGRSTACASAGAVAGSAEAQRARPARRPQRAAAAHPRPLRQPHRPRRLRPELALAAARRRRARDPLAAVARSAAGRRTSCARR